MISRKHKQPHARNHLLDLRATLTKNKKQKPKNKKNQQQQFSTTGEKVIDVDATETKAEEEVKDDKFLKETEAVTGSSEEAVFQAETAKLLDIVTRSLYTDKEVMRQQNHNKKKAQFFVEPSPGF